MTAQCDAPYFNFCFWLIEPMGFHNSTDAGMWTTVACSGNISQGGWDGSK